LREDSETFEKTMRLTLGAGKSYQLLIPRGVAHGVANIWDRRMHMIYMVNNKFDINDPDEHRLDWDIFGDGFWELTKG